MEDDVIVMIFVSLVIIAGIVGFVLNESVKPKSKPNTEKDESGNNQTYQGAVVTQRDDQWEKDKKLIVDKAKKIIAPSRNLVSNIGKNINKNINLKISGTYLKSTSWILVQDEAHVLFTFRDNNQLAITENGIVTKGEYDLISQNRSIIITKNGLSEHFYFVNVYDNYFFLNKISTKEIVAFVNHDKFNDGLRNEFLIKADSLKKSLE